MVLVSFVFLVLPLLEEDVDLAVLAEAVPDLDLLEEVFLHFVASALGFSFAD